MIKCGAHGLQEEAFVCRHLLESLDAGNRVGFRATLSRGDAWCDDCERARLAEGGETGDWNERSEIFAGIKIVCGRCYDRIRALNLKYDS